jgi:hypothetical protein
VFEVTRGQAQILPFIAGGILILSGADAAVYLLLAGAFATFVLAMYETWVFLVEILR